MLHNSIKFWTLLLSFFMLSFLSQAQNIQQLNKNQVSVSLHNKTMHYYKDADNRLNFDQVKNKKFSPSVAKDNNYGLNNATFWFRFQLQNTDTEQKEWLLEITYPLLDYIDFYYQEGTQWKVLKMGDLQPFSQRPFYSHNFVVPVKLNDAKIHTYYVKVRGTSIIQLPLLVYQPQEYQKRHELENAIANIEYGILLVMIFYNLFIYISLRGLPYLLYSLSLCNALMFTTVLKGHALQYLWPNYPVFTNNSFMLFAGLFLACLLLYTIYFLHTSKYVPRLRKVLFALAAITGIGGLVSLVSVPVAVAVVVPISLVVMPLIIYTSVVCYRKGMVAARFFIAAWLVLASGVVLYALGALDIIPTNFLVNHLLDIGMVLAVMLLSFALSDRYRHYKRAQEEAQAQVLLMQKEANAELEAKVQERTSELRQKSDEILAQNEELYQQQEEILSQNEFIADTNTKLKREGKKTQKSIQTAQTIQKAILPAGGRLKKAFDENYFVIYKPKDIVSGDFYWMSKPKQGLKTESLHRNNKVQAQGQIGLRLTTKNLSSVEVTFVAVVDCTGHGVPGAFMSMIGNSLLNEIVNESKILDTHKILDRLNQKVRQELNQDENADVKQGMDVCLCKLEKMPNGSTKVTFTGAKRPLYYVNAQGMNVIKGDRISIGGWNNKLEEEFTFDTVHLQKGDMLYLTTDGFADSPNVRRKSFGSRRLKELIMSCAHLSVKKQQEIFENVLHEYQQGADQRDDITVFGIRV